VRSPRRALAFVIIASVSAVTLLASAQQKKPAVTAPVKRTPVKPTKGLTPDADDAGALSTKDERAPSVSTKDSGTVNVGESRTLDGGTRVMRFGEVEVEGRLKSPQIVYFLRRVRAEFAAGDLGHRSFVRELSETRNEPGF
jgi:hypothetical protein